MRTLIPLSNLDDLMEHLEGAKRYDNYILALCPFHSDHRPSLLVYHDWFRCLSCGEEGKPDKLLAHVSGSSFTFSPVKYFDNPWSGWLAFKSLKSILCFAYTTLKDKPYLGVYMHNRGIDTDALRKLRIGFYDGWFTFPIRDLDKHIIGAIARAGEGTQAKSRYMIPKGQDPNLLYFPSPNAIKPARKVYLTFGIIDAISLLIVGLPALSTTTGKRIDPEVLRDLNKFIYLVPDEKEEVEAGMIASKLGWRAKVIRITYPEGAKDCNDLLRMGLLANTVLGWQ